jgi:hypothetical protein
LSVSEQIILEEGFGHLFKAARVLFREGVTDEGQIFPTLAFALSIGSGRDPDRDPREHDPFDHLDYDYKRLVKARESGETWGREANRFVSGYGSLRPVRIVDEILILEMLPVGITISNDWGTENPREVWITVYPRRQSPKPEDVASLYDETLSNADIPHGEFYTGGMRFGFYSGFLDITIERGTVEVKPDKPRIFVRPKAAPFPHPRIVQEFFRMLLKAPFGDDGFYGQLGIRSRGGAPTPDNLIPACVAFFLRNAGQIEGRKEIHRLLNKHVLCEIPWRKLTEDGSSSPETIQLWRDVQDESKIGNPLRAVRRTLFWQGRG